MTLQHTSLPILNYVPHNSLLCVSMIRIVFEGCLAHIWGGVSVKQQLCFRRLVQGLTECHIFDLSWWAEAAKPAVPQPCHDSLSAPPIPGSGMCLVPQAVSASPAVHLQHKHGRQWVTDTRKYIDKYLKTNPPEKKKPNPWYTMFANLCGVNTHIITDFRLPMWCHWTWIWEEISTTDSVSWCERSPSSLWLLAWVQLVFMSYTMYLWVPACPCS